MQDTVDVTQTGWVDVLNRDPRNRVPAGFGVSVVRENQESYIARAWAQVQNVLAANRVIRLVAYAMRASQTVYANFAATLPPERSIAFFAPVLRKVLGSPTTLQNLLNASTLPPSAVSAAMRRLIRPRGAIARRIATADAAFSHGALVNGLAANTLTAAPPRQPGADLATDVRVAAALPGHPTIPSPPPPTAPPTTPPTTPNVTANVTADDAALIHRPQLLAAGAHHSSRIPVRHRHRDRRLDHDARRRRDRHWRLPHHRHLHALHEQRRWLGQWQRQWQRRLW